MNFNDLSDEAKVLFIIFASNLDWWSDQLMKAYYASGAPVGSGSRAADEMCAFLRHSQQAGKQYQRELKKRTQRGRL